MSGLLLGRKPSESIMIGDDIEVTIEGVRGKNVSVRVDAPKHIPVNRREVYDAIHNTNSISRFCTRLIVNDDNLPAMLATIARVRATSTSDNGGIREAVIDFEDANTAIAAMVALEEAGYEVTRKPVGIVDVGFVQFGRPVMGPDPAA